ncbi:site-specific integrase [Thioclava sp. FR2]|uniref:site-specific integrase n=1 Tax=Thioclava sp. FR2 TaxID=3445780 RepID=UPI003EB9D1C0
MSRKINEKNERVKRLYARWKAEARRADEKTVDKALDAVDRFSRHTDAKDFRNFSVEQAISFKRALDETPSARTGAPLAKATVDGILRAVKDFFDWLADQPGYRSRIKRRDLEYFNLSAKDVRTAHASRFKRAPTLEQCGHVFRLMPEETMFDQRDKAIFATLMLTGARDGALSSFRLRNVDLIDGCIHQDARNLKTKFAKSFSTWFFPVDPMYRVQLAAWISVLRDKYLFGPSDALFPKPQMGLIDGAFAAVGLTRSPYGNAAKVREVVKRAFEAADLPAVNPHSFRDMLVAHGSEVCSGPAAFKAWSMNLGHDSVVTTISAYCNIPVSSQRDLMKRMWE